MNVCSDKFESWRKEQIASLVRTGHLEAARKFNELGSIHWMAWRSAWQASRERLVIELPKPDGDDGDSWDQCFKSGVSQCRDAIHAAGVKTR